MRTLRNQTSNDYAIRHICIWQFAAHLLSTSLSAAVMKAVEEFGAKARQGQCSSVSVKLSSISTDGIIKIKKNCALYILIWATLVCMGRDRLLDQCGLVVTDC